MIEITISKADCNQRADKFITHHLPGASKSLIYKQIRKKNITLNGKKMDGSEKLVVGDKIQFFFSQDTYDKFSKVTTDNNSTLNNQINNAINTYKNLSTKITIVYEDDNIIIVNKPAGILTQANDDKGMSLNDWLIGYLLNSAFLSEESLAHFKPSVLNRLDRNTSGMVICSKSHIGAVTISNMLSSRDMHKYYFAIVCGVIEKNMDLQGYHKKNESSNNVKIKPSLNASDNASEFDLVHTYVKPIHTIKGRNNENNLTLVEVKLITGKSHQIRAHLSSINHPILGDPKYGKKEINNQYKEYGINYQLLHAYKLCMPDSIIELPELNNKNFICPPDKIWQSIDPDIETAWR